MKIEQDWHIHSEHSCDGACLKMEELIIEAEQTGILNYGISDHLHSSYNMADIINSKKNYDAIISKNPALKEIFHFGIEASCMSEWELDKIRKGDYRGDATYGIRQGGPKNAKPAIDIDKGSIEQMGIEYVIGGVHWGLYCDMDRDSILKDYHRQCMYLIQHEEIDILAHYLWWNQGAFPDIDNPFADFGNIPQAMKQEMAFALKQYGCAFELNLCAVFLASNLSDRFKREYLEYVAEMQSMGVILAIGSDCHNPHYADIDFEKSSEMLEKTSIDLSDNIFGISKN